MKINPTTFLLFAIRWWINLLTVLEGGIFWVVPFDELGVNGFDNLAGIQGGVRWKSGTVLVMTMTMAKDGKARRKLSNLPTI